MTKTKTSYKLIETLRKSRSFLIVSHINPEGDAIGSTLALALGLKKTGKKDICVLNRDGVPEILKFLPSSTLVRQKAPAKTFDLLVIVDCNSMERTGYKELKAKNTIIIDHHVLTAEEMRSDFYRSVSAALIDPHAAATGMLIYKVLGGMKIPIDRAIATNLYTAILIDTGGFRYSNVSPESLQIASHLVEAGASPWDITKEVFESIPYRSMKLLAMSLSTIDSKDKVGWMTTTEDMFRKTGATAEDAEDFVDFPRKIQGIEAAVYFREDKKDVFKLSLRSKGKVDVQKVAKGFGGGGHVAAAGCKVNGPLKEVQKKVLKAVRDAIKNS